MTYIETTIRPHGDVPTGTEVEVQYIDTDLNVAIVKILDAPVRFRELPTYCLPPR